MVSKSATLFMSVITFILSTNILIAQGGLDQRIAELSQQITKEMTEYQKTTIAVVEFVDLQGNVTDFGRFLAEELITRLYQTKKFKVIERQLLNKIIGEQKLSLTGLIDPASIKQLGKLLGVDAICSGTVTDLTQSLRVNARLVSTETGEIFAVASNEIFKDESITKLMSKSAMMYSTSGPALAATKSPIEEIDGHYPKFENQRLRIISKSLKKSNSEITLVLLFENLESESFKIWLAGDRAEYTYLLDENGERWNLVNESANLKVSGFSDSRRPTLVPGTRLASKFRFEPIGKRDGTLFSLIMKLDASAKEKDWNNLIDVILNDLKSE